MNLKCLLIICTVSFKFVEMKSECGEHFKCFGEFMKEFIKSGLKYDIIIKETKYDDDHRSDTSVVAIEIPSNKLINAIKQVIHLFDIYFEGQSDNEDEFKSTVFTEDLTFINAQNITSDKENKTLNNKKDFKLKSDISVENNSSNNNNSKVKGKYVMGNELRIDEFEDYYDIEYENATDYPIIDYIELYKDTTNDPVHVIATEIPNIDQFFNTTAYIKNSSSDDTSLNGHSALNVQQQCSFNGSIEEFTRTVFPWIAAIFVKNGKSEQFDYYCDGALLSDRAILTAANCVSHNVTMVEADDVIVVLGKGSLKTMGDKEKVVKVSEIRLHDNFTSKYEDGHDLAVIRIDEPISSSDAVHPACLATGNDTDDFIQDDFDIATTGWAISNELTPICLDREKSKLCQKDVISDDTFCANYNNDVTTCPSYGGVFAAKAADEVWRLRGLRTGDTSQKGFCINTGVFYTDLLLHTEWIQNNI